MGEGESKSPPSPIPPCDPADLRRAWKSVWLHLLANKAWDNRTHDLCAVAYEEGEIPTSFRDCAVTLRCMLVGLMIHEGPKMGLEEIATWMHGDELSDAVLRVASSFPFTLPGQFDVDHFAQRVRQEMQGRTG